MMNSEDARSDFVLAAAAAALLPFVAGFVSGLPGYPVDGIIGGLLAIVWLGLTMLFVPIVIVRYREEGLSAFSIGGQRQALGKVAVVAVPIVVLGYLRSMSLMGPFVGLLGRLGIPLGGTPTVGAPGADLVDLVLRVLYIAVLLVGSIGLTGFLVSRAEDAFRSPDMPVVEALRTFGMGAAAASLVLGLLATVGRGYAITTTIGASLALAATVLLADRFVYGNMTTTRAGIIGPAIATLAFHILSTGGVLGGDLVTGLWWGSLGFGLVVVAASLSKTKATSIAFVVPIVAATLYPTCIAPVSLAQGIGISGFCPG